MKQVACKTRHLVQRCRQRGTTLERVKACIVSTQGDDLLVDVEHPAYPKPRPPIARPPRRTPAEIWHAAHVRSGQPVVDQDAEQRHLDHLADGTGCKTCKTHWRERRKAVRINTATLAAYTYALWLEHNIISTIAGRPLLPWHDACRLYGWPTTPAH